MPGAEPVAGGPGLRVAVDAFGVGTRLTGAGRFLVRVLAALPEVDPGIRCVALVTAAGEELVAAAAPLAERVVVPVQTGLGWERSGLGRAAAAAGADVVLTIREHVGRGGPPVVMHVFEPPAWRLHSAHPKSVPAFRWAAKDLFLQIALGRSVRRAAAVTAGSRTTAEWLHRRYGVAARVVLPGLEPAFLEMPSPAAGAAAGDGLYFLHLVTSDPRDDTDLVLRAFAGAACPRVRLLLPGGLADARRAAVLARARALGVEGLVEPLGWVTDDRLRALYRGALALVHPSRYESYAGFPALEAMASGAPVVALEAPGVTEALEGAAVLVPGRDSGLVGAALARLAADPALRADLARKGRERVRPLTWQATARELAGVLRAAAARRG